MKRLHCTGTLAGSAAFVALVLTGPALFTPAMAQNAPTLVIQGGTLIDGNGGDPVENAIVVIEGNQIVAAGSAAAITIPAGAETIDATGKYILPGLWDSQVSYSWFFGELFLQHGVTSLVDIGLGGEMSIAARDAVNEGYARGPREWIGIGHFGGFDEEELTGYETPYDGRQLPRTFEELQTETRLLLDAGADMIMFHDGNWDPEWVKWACDEAHARGKPCTQRAGGPRMGAREAALAGVDMLPHARGIGDAIVADGVDVGNNELDKFTHMDDTKARDIIDLMVREEVYLLPNIIHEAPGYPADWPAMQEAYENIFANPALLAYYPEGFRARLERTRRDTATGELRERRMVGYQNMLRFYKMMIDAGGRVLVAGDTNGAKVPGSIMHEEMAIFQEAGITPMQIIMGSTSWAADAMRVSDHIGTVEAGKLADIIIVNADPLADIRNMRQIDTVIQDGRVIDTVIHADYSVPFAAYDNDQRYTINDGHWVAALKDFSGTPRAMERAPAPDTSPQPAIEAIMPTMVERGSETITLELTGFNFVAGSRVLVDGQSVPWEWTDGSKLNVTIDANILASAGRKEIVVVNPQPMDPSMWGNGRSNQAYLVVKF